MEKEQQLFKVGSTLESQKSAKAFLSILWMWSDLGDWSEITEVSPTSSYTNSLLLFPNSSLNPLYWHCSRTTWTCGWGTMSAGAPLRLRCCWRAPLVKSPPSGSSTCQSRTTPALCCEGLDIRGTTHTFSITRYLYHSITCIMLYKTAFKTSCQPAALCHMGSEKIRKNSRHGKSKRRYLNFCKSGRKV